MADKDGIVVEFQSFTGVEDLNQCIAILEQHDWNLQDAVQTVMAGFDSPGDINAASLGHPLLEQPPRPAEAIPESISSCLSGSVIDPVLIDDVDMTAFATREGGFPEAAGSSNGARGFGLSSTGLRLGHSSTSALRLLYFDIQYRERIVKLSVHDHETVGKAFGFKSRVADLSLYCKLGKLKELLSAELGIAVAYLELHGWPNKSDAMIRDSDLLRNLRLPRENTLYLLTPELPRSADTAATQRLAEEELASRVYELSIHHEEADKTYPLKYPAQRTIHDVKVDVYTLIDVNVRHQVWTGWPDVSDSTTLGKSGISYPVHVLTVRSCGPSTSGFSLTRPPLHTSSHSPSSASNPIELDSDDDVIGDEDVEIIEPDDALSSRSVKPLMPSNCSNQIEAVEYFYREFTVRYGEPHPVFYIGTLEDAIRDALQCKARERKLLAIYLHHDNSIQANVFCSQTLCTDMMVSYLAHNYLLWAWDLTHESNKNVLLQLCNQHFGTVASNTVKAFQPDQLPLMLLISRSRSTNEVLHVIQGNETLDGCMQHLMHVVELCQPQKLQDIQEEEEREARDRMLAEQDAAYQESLAMDRAKMESKKLEEESLRQKFEEERQKQQNDQLKLQEEEAVRKAVQESIASRLPAEPPADSSESISTIRVKCPDGRMMTRRFIASHPLQVLLDYITSEGFHIEEYKVLSTFPRRDLTQLDKTKSLKEVQLHPQETVILEKL